MKRNFRYTKPNVETNNSILEFCPDSYRDRFLNLQTYDL